MLSTYLFIILVMVTFRSAVFRVGFLQLFMVVIAFFFFFFSDQVFAAEAGVRGEGDRECEEKL